MHPTRYRSNLPFSNLLQLSYRVLFENSKHKYRSFLSENHHTTPYQAWPSHCCWSIHLDWFSIKRILVISYKTLFPRLMKIMDLSLIKTLLSVPENQSELVWTVTKYFEHKDPQLSTGRSSPLRALARVVRFVVVCGVTVDVKIDFSDL